MEKIERNGSPILDRQRSVASAGSLSPAKSPSHHVRSASQPGSGTLTSVRKSQNYAAKAAAARLAQVMQANRDSVDDEEEDDMQFQRYTPSYGLNVSRDQSPKLLRPYEPLPGRTTTYTDTSVGIRPVSTGRSTLSQRPTPMVPPAPIIHRPRMALPTGSATLRMPDPAAEPITERSRRFSADMVNLNARHDNIGPNSRRETAVLHDQIDILQEENETLLDKLRLMEEKLEGKETRSRELEKQVASLGEGITLESRLLIRKEQFLKQREAALKAAKEQSKDVKDDEIAALRLEAEAARDEAMAASEAAREAEIEVKALRTMTHRMILTQEEMEEVVLKRCWLARYWALAARHGVHPEIAHGKYEHWSSLAPLPLEVVLSAGQKAKEEPSPHMENGASDEALVLLQLLCLFHLRSSNLNFILANGNQVYGGRRKAKATRDVNDITGEGNIESMLSVEKGLRELASLKVDDAVMLAIAQRRRPSSVRVDSDQSADGSKMMDALDLSAEEVEDVQFKQAWLIYFWRRAKNNGVEDDIADERLQFWVSQSNQQPTSQDKVDVVRGLMELRKLGIEEQLWELSRREIAHEAANQKLVDPEHVLGPSSSHLQRLASSLSVQST